MQVAVLKRVQVWVCLTGVNLRIGADTTIPTTVPLDDGVNYVFFTTALPPNTNAETDIYTGACYPPTIAFQRTADMRFNSTTTFIYDSTDTQNLLAGQVDFYGVCLHELGHFIGLAHHTDTTNLMYFAGNTGPKSAADRKRLIVSTSCSA